MADYILCPRAEDIPLDDMEDGTTKTACSECGQAVWIGPNGVKFKEKTKFPVICVPCMRKHCQGDVPPHVQAFMLSTGHASLHAGMQALLNVFGKFLRGAEESSANAEEKRREEIRRN